jgi:bifunctional non-homologous end joining protein LigD
MSMDVSRPDKVLYPGPDYTKADLAEYYDAVAEVMLPHLGARALMLHCFPDSIDETGFYQKQLPANAPEFLATVTVDSNNRSGQVRHLTINDRGRDTLGWLADQACVEVHRWLSRTDAVDNPDLLVLDLDPPTPRDLGALRRTALAVRDLFDKIGLSPFLMATGGNGYHVVAPLDRATGFDEVRDLVRDLADVLATREPDTLTTQQRKVKRGNRIFLDTNRNAYGQTAIAPYSPRPPRCTRCHSDRVRRAGSGRTERIRPGQRATAAGAQGRPLGRHRRACGVSDVGPRATEETTARGLAEVTVGAHAGCALHSHHIRPVGRRRGSPSPGLPPPDWLDNQRVARDMATHQEAIRELLDEAGRTYAAESGITRRDKPAPLYRLLVLSAVPASELADAGMGTAKGMLDAS